MHSCLAAFILCARHAALEQTRWSIGFVCLLSRHRRWRLALWFVGAPLQSNLWLPPGGDPAKPSRNGPSRYVPVAEAPQSIPVVSYSSAAALPLLKFRIGCGILTYSAITSFFRARSAAKLDKW